MNFSSSPNLSVDHCQSEIDGLWGLLVNKQTKKQDCFKKILLVRNLLVSSISRTDSEQLKEELEKILEMIYEISREI